jgi:hypothetical protein
MERHYPTINESQLWPFNLVRQHLMEDPTYLDGPECPYPGEVKRFLSLLVPPKTKSLDALNAEAGDLGTAEGDELDLEKELKRLLNEIREYGRKLGLDESAEKATYFRISTALMEKLVALLEKAHGAKRQQEFEAFILKFLEDECSPDVRTRLMDRLSEVGK